MRTLSVFNLNFKILEFERKNSGIKLFRVLHRMTFWRCLPLFFSKFSEACSHDRTNITEFRLEHDRKIFTTIILYSWTWPKNMTTTNINFTPQKYVGAVGLDRLPSSHWLWHLPSLASPVASHLYTKKNHWFWGERGGGGVRPCFKTYVSQVNKNIRLGG